jgi:hypothetical protein
VVGAPVHEQGLARCDERRGRCLVDDHARGGLFGRAPVPVTGAQWLAVPARVDDDRGPQLLATSQPDGAGLPSGGASRADLHAVPGQLAVEVGAQRGDVQDRVVPAQPVLGERNRPSRCAGRHHRGRQVGGQLLGPAAVGGPPRRLRRGVEQHRLQPAPGDGGGEGPAGRPAADDEHVGVAVHVHILPVEGDRGRSGKPRCCPPGSATWLS